MSSSLCTCGLVVSSIRVLVDSMNNLWWQIYKCVSRLAYSSITFITGRGIDSSDFQWQKSPGCFHLINMNQENSDTGVNLMKLWFFCFSPLQLCRAQQKQQSTEEVSWLGLAPNMTHLAHSPVHNPSHDHDNTFKTLIGRTFLYSVSQYFSRPLNQFCLFPSIENVIAAFMHAMYSPVCPPGASNFSVSSLFSSSLYGFLVYPVIPHVSTRCPHWVPTFAIQTSLLIIVLQRHPIVVQSTVIPSTSRTITDR